jgi:ribosomal protein S6
MVYTGKGDIVAEIERNLRLNDTVLRFMSVNLAKEFDKDVFMKEIGAGTSLKREDKAPGSETPASA